MSVQITRILVYEYEEYEVFFYECTKYSNFRLRVRGVRGSKNFVQNYLLKINLVYSSRLRVRDNIVLAFTSFCKLTEHSRLSRQSR